MSGERGIIAKVAVSDIPCAIDQPYDYLVPQTLAENAAPGVRVTVPFGRGNRKYEGLILAQEEGEKRPGLKPLLETLDHAPILDQAEISLALWMRQRYFCTVFEAVRTILPAGILCREPADGRRITGQGSLMAELAVPLQQAMEAAERRRSPMYRDVIRFLSSAGKAACADVRYYTGATMKQLRAMEKAGMLAFTEEEPLSLPQQEREAPRAPLTLNAEQQAAFTELLSLLEDSRPGAALLQGVTGSGKTLLYLRLVQEVLKRGKTAIVLVPEIILTPQMMDRFAACFGDDVAMLHSSLRVAERREQWLRLRRGEARVALGTRSAIFAPLRNIGLIVLDEEQEGSYYSKYSPRYHARDIAKYLCAKNGAALLLGSATPSIESAWNAEQGIYRKAVLRSRYNEQSLPEVTIADLREEVRAGNSGTIGRILRRELEKNLAAGEQSILFLNRRGSSRMLLCGECGYVPECPRCTVPLVWHSANGRFMCHHCGHSQIADAACPRCGGRMKPIGAGTQKVEEELRRLFPDTEILRMDADTAGGRHGKILARFARERIPILLGTQMVAKGLDFAGVTLVGALLADLSLYAEHYRAAERTFSLLTQVAGRAGRGERRGRAVIQTYAPDNSVIQSAARQDYARFYAEEIRFRRLRRCPPFADLFTLTVSGGEESVVLRAAVKVRETLRGLCTRPEIARWQPEVLGPAPAPVLKVNNDFRYRVLLVGKNDKAVREALRWLLKEFFRDRANRGVHLLIDCNGPD